MCAVATTTVLGILIAVRVVNDPIAIRIAAGAMVWLVPWAIRKQFTGVFVGEEGVCVRETLRTQTFGWPDIASFEVRPSEYAISGGTASQALWIVTPAGLAMETPVVRGSFMMAEMPRGSEFYWTGSGRSHLPKGYFLAGPVFDEVVHRLRADLASRCPQAVVTYGPAVPRRDRWWRGWL